MADTSAQVTKLTKKDFDPGVDVRWCPGCGDYSILANMQRTMPTFGKPKESFVFVSGIGCSSRFPYYMNTYGFHTIHGRAPALATGLRAFRSDLEVWVVTGDGDGLSIGGNHLIHAMRRNVSLKIMLFNNQIYGLTKGQYSPTSEVGKRTKSTPQGSIDTPFKPLALALAAECTFVARVADTDAKLMQELLTAAHEHEGTAFIEILQNCPVFNDGAFDKITAKATKANAQFVLKHGEVIRTGAGGDGAFVWRNGQLEPVRAADVPEAALVVHDEANPALGFALAQLQVASSPIPVGILRRVRRPTYDSLMQGQIEAAKATKRHDLQALLHGADTWTVA